MFLLLHSKRRRRRRRRRRQTSIGLGGGKRRNLRYRGSHRKEVPLSLFRSRLSESDGDPSSDAPCFFCPFVRFWENCKLSSSCLVLFPASLLWRCCHQSGGERERERQRERPSLAEGGELPKSSSSSFLLPLFPPASLDSQTRFLLSLSSFSNFCRRQKRAASTFFPASQKRKAKRRNRKVPKSAKERLSFSSFLSFPTLGPNPPLMSCGGTEGRREAVPISPPF